MSPTLAAVPGDLLERVRRMLLALERNREGYCPRCDREFVLEPAHYEDCDLAALFAELAVRR